MSRQRTFPRGAIPEIPPTFEYGALRRVLQMMRNELLAMRDASFQGAKPVTNLQVNPIAGGNNVRFTRSNGDEYVLYWSTSPNFSTANGVGLGQNADYNDDVGKAAVVRHYWVVTRRQGVDDSAPVGPKSGTTLTLTTETTLPAPPVGSDQPTRDELRDTILYF